MIADLLRTIRDIAQFIPALEDAIVTVATNPRFDALVEGKVNVILAPVSILYDYQTRDVVKETTTVSVSVAEYFADKFSDEDALGLLRLVPEIEQAFFGLDMPVADAHYHFEAILALGEPNNETLKDVPGGLLDVAAADNAYIYQAPVYITYSRYLAAPPRQIIKLYSVAPGVSCGGSPPAAIIAPGIYRTRLQIFDGDTNSTMGLIKQGILRFG